MEVLILSVWYLCIIICIFYVVMYFKWRSGNYVLGYWDLIDQTIAGWLVYIFSVSVISLFKVSYAITRFLYRISRFINKKGGLDE